MILRSISVRNIRSYEDGEIHLGGGITTLSGEIGAGKSTLLHALEMALFGFASFDAEHLLRHGAKEGEVEVVLDDQGSLISLRRTLTRKTSRGEDRIEQKCSFARDGHRTSYSITEMKRKVIELLGFPDDPNPKSSSDLWRWAVYVPQEGMRAVLSQDQDERLETIRRAHGLEEYRTARDNADLLAQDLRATERNLKKLAELYGEGSRGIEEVQAKLREETERLQELRGAKEDAERGLAEARTRAELKRDLERDAAVIEDRMRSLDRRLHENTQARDQATQLLGELRSRIATAREVLAGLERAFLERPFDPGRLSTEEKLLESQLAKTEDLRLTHAKLQAKRAQWTSGQESLAESEKLLDALRHNLEQRERTLAQREKELPAEVPKKETPRELPELDQAAQEVQKKLKTLAEEIGAARHSEQELRELIDEGKCPRCGQGVKSTDFQDHVAQTTRKLAQLEKQRDQWERKLAGVGDERARRLSFEQNELRRQESLRRTDEARTELGKARESIAETEASIGTRRKSLERLSRESEGVEEAEQVYTASRQEDDGLRARVEELRSLSRARKLEEERLSEARDRLSQFETERDRAEEMVERQGAIVGHSLEERSAAQERLTKIRTILGPLADAELRERDANQTWALARERCALSEQTVTYLGEEIARKEKALVLQRVAEARSQRAHHLSDWLGLFCEATGEIEQRRFERIHGEFSAEFSKYFRQLVDEPILTAVLDPTFQPLVRKTVYETPSAALSGGERTALALAYRLGLGHTVLSEHRLRLGTLILDEPSDGFSIGQMAKLGELLRSLHHEQIILVTHDPSLGSIADHHRSISKLDGRSRVSSP